MTVSKQQTQNEQLEKRMLTFTVSVIGLLRNNLAIPRSISDQLIRSCASVGANYAEACNASSRLDFRNKIYISKKEAAETRYWIDLCIELDKNKDWSGLRQEINELLMILQAIINTLKASAK